MVNSGNTIIPEPVPVVVRSLGLVGVWAQLGNMTAVLVICLLFYQDRHISLDLAKEDRILYREQLAEFRKETDNQWAILRSLVDEIRRIIRHLEETKK